MANSKAEDSRPGSPWRIIGWSLAGLVLLIPLVAMQFTKEVQWTVGDFMFAALLIGLVGTAFELAVRASANGTYRGGAAAALAASFLTVWVNGAVGMIGSEDNSYNLLFLGVILVALAGSILARFRPRGMSLTMFTAAGLQAVLGVAGMATDVRGGIFATLFAGLWLLAAALLRQASLEDQA